MEISWKIPPHLRDQVDRKRPKTGPVEIVAIVVAVVFVVVVDVPAPCLMRRRKRRDSNVRDCYFSFGRRRIRKGDDVGGREVRLQWRRRFLLWWRRGCLRCWWRQHKGPSEGDD